MTQNEDDLRLHLKHQMQVNAERKDCLLTLINIRKDDCVPTERENDDDN